MNIKHILTEIEKVDPEVYERLDTRRASLRSFSGIGKNIALTALPLALGSMFKKAYGQTGTTSFATVVEVLNYALTLEYLEADFYGQALAAPTLIFPTDIAKGAITTIKTHEDEHVTTLTATIKSLSGIPVTKPTFNFVGVFPTVFTDYATFLTVSQTFEDTGVRAYKGQANNTALMQNNTVLKAALQIHSVEARHASHVRYMRRLLSGNTAIKGWITGNDTAGSPVTASYAGEENTTQGGTVVITSLTNSSTSATFTSATATEAFDEPLTSAQVLAIVDPFY